MDHNTRYAAERENWANEKIDRMDRAEIVKLLEEVACIQCYDHESDDELREALRANVDDGTILPVYLNNEND